MIFRTLQSNLWAPFEDACRSSRVNGVSVRGSKQFVALLIAGTALFLLINAYLLPGSATLLPLPHQTIMKANEDTQKLEIEGLSLGKPFKPPANVSEHFEPLEWLLESFKARVESLETPSFHHAYAPQVSSAPEYPSCELNLARYEGTALAPHQSKGSKSRGHRDSSVSIAINLFDSASIIPSQSLAILEAVSYLLAYNKVFISVFENGSSDNTRDQLSEFAAAAQVIGVDGIFVLSSKMGMTTMAEDRIVLLSEIRNRALTPLIPYANSLTGAATLIFLNDVVTCASDILELIHQQRLQRADMVLGMDWGAVSRDEDSSVQKARLYDMWVARGINGELFYPFEKDAGYTPLTEHDDWVRDAFSTQSEDIYDRWLDGRPFPIYSGWGGMAAFNASLFTMDHLRFRSSIASNWNGGSTTGALGNWGELLGADGYLESDCRGASECEYICRDIWNLRGGSARIVLAPQVRTTYSVADWNILTAQVPVTRRNETDKIGADLVDWSNITIPATVDCIATREEEGSWIDTWDELNVRTKLSPLFRPHNLTKEP